MAFTPFTKDDLPTMAAFNEKLQAIFDDAESKAKFEAGTYVGTGTYGSSNPNTLTFGFEPKLVIIGPYNFRRRFAWVYGATKVGTSLDGDGAGYGCIVSLNDKTLSYYSGDSYTAQLNDGGEIYHYIAIG